MICNYQIFSWAATEWFYSRNQPKVGSRPLGPNTSLSPSVSWTPPSFQLKLNIDYLAAVCIDYCGSWLGGVCMATFCSNAIEADIRAILMALKWAKQQNREFSEFKK